MKVASWKIGALLFVLGLIGVATMLLSKMPLDLLPAEATELVDPKVLPYLLLINPIIYLLIAVVIGSVLYRRAGYRLPVFESVFTGDWSKVDLPSIFKNGIGWGLLAGVSIVLFSAALMPSLPAAFQELGEKMQMHPLSRFGYGGITEELLMRYGMQTFLAFLLGYAIKNNDQVKHGIAILIAAILFGLGHLPVVLLLGTVTPLLVVYIILGNTIGGIIFGYLYWKHGLFAAMLGHIFAHVAMLIGDSLVG